MLGTWLRESRGAKGWSQQHLATMLGVSQTKLSQWENGHSRPSEALLEKLKSLFGPPEPRRREFRPDSFVTWLDEFQRTICGKVREVTPEGVRVALFHPTETDLEELVVPSETLESRQLPAQTVVYVRRSGGGWKMGRTTSDQTQLGAEVRFPNDKDVYSVPLRSLFVRPRVDDDPTELLAHQLTSAPYFAEARHKFKEFVAAQRAAYQGLTALGVAQIEPHRHQLLAVRRVLADPVQRYLLADEVGLGKTIEAGLLIAQHTIDDGDAACVLIITPDALVNQWIAELKGLFGLLPAPETGDGTTTCAHRLAGGSPSARSGSPREAVAQKPSPNPRLRVVPFSKLEGGNLDLSATPSMLVVDEAHQCARWAFPDDGPAREDSARRYTILERLAAAPKVLLLSGTPVLHNEDGFLAMLHLLEPSAYSLEDREGFRQRIAARQVVADTLAELTPDFTDSFLLEALERLAPLAEGDAPLTVRISGLRTALEGSSASSAVAELRSYLQERYRLHRRILRTHRESASVAKWLPKRTGASALSAGADPPRERAFEALEEWRRDAQDGPPVAASRALSKLLSAALCHPTQLAAECLQRADRLAAGSEQPLFGGEELSLRQVAEEFHNQQGDDPRVLSILEALKLQPPGRRSVVFADAPEVADLVHAQLVKQHNLKPRLVRLVNGGERALEHFDRTGAILVCDRRSEEGLNLQRHAASVYFYDLPFDFGRLEQRIGRFDRIGGQKTLSFTVPSPVGPYERAWWELLRQSVKVFERSVARLQYVLADEMSRLQQDLLRDGANGFQLSADRMAEPMTGLEAQLKMLRRQELLDVSDFGDFDVDATWQEEVERAGTLAARDGRQAIEGWLSQVKFLISEHRDEDDRQTVSYEHRAGPPDATLVPRPPLRKVLTHEGRSAPQKGNWTFGPYFFDRQEAPDGALLLGLGHPFFDSVYRMMQADERSRSWAMWRLAPSARVPEVYFCFDLLVEASIDMANKHLRKPGMVASLRRRADESFPVVHRKVWVKQDGTPIPSSLIGVLNRPYVKSRGDTNLNPSRWAQANLQLDVGDWAAVVRARRAQVESETRKDPAVIAACEEAAQRMESIGLRSLRILSARLDQATVRERAPLEEAKSLEQKIVQALVQGCRNPAFRVDNVGAVILASQRLPPGPGDDDDAD